MIIYRSRCDAQIGLERFFVILGFCRSDIQEVVLPGFDSIPAAEPCGGEADRISGHHGGTAPSCANIVEPYCTARSQHDQQLRFLPLQPAVNNIQIPRIDFLDSYPTDHVRTPNHG